MGGGDGGGIHTTVGNTSLDHTIVAGNFRSAFTRSDLGGAATATRYSLIGDNAGATITDNGGNLIGTSAFPIDARLDVLSGVQGEITSVHALRPGSPAINAGDPAAVAGAGTVPAKDQRGGFFNRVFGGRIDIGAVERQTLPVGTLVVDSLLFELDGNYSAGDLTLLEAISIANEASLGMDTISFAPGLTSGGPATISAGLFIIEDALTINGPGADLLTIDETRSDPTPLQDNGDGSTIFSIFVDSGFAPVIISGLTLSEEIRGVAAPSKVTKI
jgi:hypothetical protein